MKNNFFVYDYKSFCDVWGDVNSFLSDWNAGKIPKKISQDSATTLYYLLYSRYGNSTIAFDDENQFKYSVFSIMFMYGPTWEERLSLQEKIRNLTDAEIQQGSKAIYNSALNPATAPSTGSLEELNYISSQNTTNYKKSRMEAIALKWDLLHTDVTSEFLAKFQSLFMKILSPNQTQVYVNTIEEE